VLPFVPAQGQDRRPQEVGEAVQADFWGFGRRRRVKNFDRGAVHHSQARPLPLQRAQKVPTPGAKVGPAVQVFVAGTPFRSPPRKSRPSSPECNLG
jgi:hypothetical protein